MKQMNTRIFRLRLAASLIVTALIYNLFQIQIIEGEQWADIADNNRFRHLVEIAPRGRIFSADGVELAGNVPGYEVALALNRIPKSANRPLINLPSSGHVREEIEEKLSKHYGDLSRDHRFQCGLQTVLMLEEHRHLIRSGHPDQAPLYPETTLFAHTWAT